MLQARQTIADFEIIRLLGKGGMGEVYEAEQKTPRRRVALKVLAPWLASDDDALQRFWREASVPAQLDHPGIVRIISMDKTAEGLAYYTMHLVRGVSLSEFIRQGKQAPQPSTLGYTAAGQATPSQGSSDPPAAADLLAAVSSKSDEASDEHRPPLLKEFLHDRHATLARIGAMASRVLASAHRQGFLHRDVKPSNLMIDQHDHLYLVDFGLTRALDPGANATRTGMVVGTPWYMSPEQAQGKAIDARSDIYSLGITLYELASGGVGPFTASRENSQSVLEQVRSGMHLPLRTLAPDIPRPLEEAIERCIQLNPKKRYQRAEDLANDLEAYLGIGKPRSPQSRREAIPKARAQLLLGAALLGIIAIAATAVISFRNSADTPEKVARTGTGVKVPGQAVANPLPAMLQDRPLRTTLSLLKKDYEPLWCRYLVGKGKYHLAPFQLNLTDFSQERTLLAIDYDPSRHWFEFSIELNQVRTKVPGQNQTGIFFGWQDPVGTDVSPPYFVVQLDEFPLKEFPHGQVTIGIARIDQGAGVRGASTWFQPLPGNKSVIPLTRSQEWHTLTVQVLDHRVTITVDKSASLDFDVASLRRMDPLIDVPDLLGIRGIWTSNGWSFFRNARVMALAAGKD